MNPVARSVQLLKRLRGISPQEKNPTGCGQQGFTLTHEKGALMNTQPNYTLDGSSSQTTSMEMAWLKLRLDRGSKEKFAEFGKLTPGLAKALLHMNDGNRPVREKRVETYARDIIAGNWELNGESITISSCGALNDGQHRCAAVAKCGIPVDVLFVFGVTHESRLTSDRGAQKGAGDYLGMGGTANANSLAAAANLLIQIETKGRPTANGYERPTKTEVRHRVESDPKIAESFSYVYRPGALKTASFSALTACHYLFSLKSEQDANEFMDKLISGVGLASRDPIYVAREKLTDPYRRLTVSERFKCIFMAWNRYRLGLTAKTLAHTMKPGETLPEPK